MNAITSIYFPRIEKHFNAEYIANVLMRSDIAHVSRVYIEPYKSPYNRTFVEIKYWHETEAAYNFVRNLRNPNMEARLIHCDDNWWVAEINKYPAKFESRKRVLTVFADLDDNDDVSSVDPVISGVGCRYRIRRR